MLAAVSGARAQLPGGALPGLPGAALPGAVEPGRDRPAIPIPQTPSFDFTIEGPRRTPVPRAVDEIQFHLNDIQVAGATTIPPERFRPLYQDLLGKDVTLSRILDVADAIEAEYRRQGYLLVRAFVPPQRVGDGNFTINVVEGFVSNISVVGGDAGTQERIRAFLQPVLDSKPLRLVTMEQALLIANDLPGVTATGLLRPSPDTPGASDLIVTVSQPGIAGGLAVDNRGSHFSGIWTVTGDFAAASLFDDGDQLAGSVTFTPEFAFAERIGAQLRYRHPLGTEGMVGSLIGTITHGEPGSTLRASNVLTNSWAVGPRLSFPIRRTRAVSLMIDAGLTFQHARIDFQGLELNRDDWRVLDVGASFLTTGFLGGAWAANVDLAQGLPFLGATDNDDAKLSRELLGARTDFTKLTGGIRFTRPIDGPFSLALAAQGQYAFDPLINGELFTLGGAQIGRGYDPGALTGDHGLGGSAELRYDHRVMMSSIVQALQPYIYVDAGRVWNVHNLGAANQNQNIESVGGGLRFWLVYNIVGGIEVARTLESVPGSDSGKRATKFLTDLAIRF